MLVSAAELVVSRLTSAIPKEDPTISVTITNVRSTNEVKLIRQVLGNLYGLIGEPSYRGQTLTLRIKRPVGGALSVESALETRASLKALSIAVISGDERAIRAQAHASKAMQNKKELSIKDDRVTKKSSGLEKFKSPNTSVVIDIRDNVGSQSGVASAQERALEYLTSKGVRVRSARVLETRMSESVFAQVLAGTLSGTSLDSLRSKYQNYIFILGEITRGTTVSGVEGFRVRASALRMKDATFVSVVPLKDSSVVVTSSDAIEIDIALKKATEQLIDEIAQKAR
jgi:hypothetical protein